jgi:hypothetical protein
MLSKRRIDICLGVIYERVHVLRQRDKTECLCELSVRPSRVKSRLPYSRLDVAVVGRALARNRQQGGEPGVLNSTAAERGGFGFAPPYLAGYQ